MILKIQLALLLWQGITTLVLLQEELSDLVWIIPNQLVKIPILFCLCLKYNTIDRQNNKNEMLETQSDYKGILIIEIQLRKALIVSLLLCQCSVGMQVFPIDIFCDDQKYSCILGDDYSECAPILYHFSLTKMYNCSYRQRQRVMYQNPIVYVVYFFNSFFCPSPGNFFFA